MKHRAQRILGVAALVGMALAMLAGPAMAQTPPDGCYLADDDEFRDVVTGEICLEGGDDVAGVVVVTPPGGVDVVTPPGSVDTGRVTTPGVSRSAPGITRAAPVAVVAGPGAAQLAQTGFGLSVGAALALGLLLLGGGALLASRRRAALEV